MQEPAKKTHFKRKSKLQAPLRRLLNSESALPAMIDKNGYCA